MALSDLAAKLDEARSLHDQRLLTEAQSIYEEVIKVVPRHFHALHALGIIAGQKSNPKKAVELIARAIDGDPNNKAVCVAHMNMGLAFMEMGKMDAALASYDRAIAINPDYADAHYSRAMVLQALRRSDAALAAYDRVIAIKPHHADAYANRGNLLRESQQFEAVIESYEKAIALNPSIQFVHGIRHHTSMQICRWDGIESALAQLREGILGDQAASSPFFVLGFSDSAQLQRRAAEIRIREKCAANHELGKIKKWPGRVKMRIGYFSADFHNHVTMYVLAELFERHDRSKIDLTIFSFGPDSNDAMRKRLRSACDDFLDVRTMSDADVARLARKRKIDIAVDLKGFTQGNRAGIFALRAAPLQVSFLGYPGSMGASYIDYLVADPTVIPEASLPSYSETIVHLPNSYYPYDTTRKISDQVFTREELGLPRSAFVFCCFNNSYKITPAVFDCWMRILRQVDGAVLWLLEDNPAASSNLRQEASKRGVSPERLVFAKRLALPEHLARQRSADLFIDTLPYNAHTTAIDALWAGLPVLTVPGEAFASRVAASLLKAIRLPELIMASQDDYENTAVALALDVQRLAGITRRLADNRLTAPLFDAKLFARHLEQAYRQMIERYQRDLPPEHIRIASDAS